MALHCGTSLFFAGSVRDANYLGIDDEYEEISSLESPHPFEVHNSVHFVLNERSKYALSKFKAKVLWISGVTNVPASAAMQEVGQNSRGRVQK